MLQELRIILNFWHSSASMPASLYHARRPGLLVVIISAVIVCASGCRSGQGIQGVKAEQASIDNSFVKGSPNQDANTVVGQGIVVTPFCEERRQRYNKIINEIIKAMAKGMGEGALKGFWGLNK